MPDRKRTARKRPTLVRATDVLVGYGSTVESAVCPPISVQVAPGQALAVVGANGTGKSTFLRAVAGLLEPLAGSIEVLGAPVDERARRFRAEVATVLDEDSYLPALTLREHLLLTARGHGATAVSDLVTEVVEEFGLAARQHALPTALSSGQRRRLLLASAFVRPRTLLVLDEPEQRLDPGMRERLAGLLVDDARDGVAVVLATHDPDLVARTGARGLLVGEDACVALDPADAHDALLAVR